MEEQIMFQGFPGYPTLCAQARALTEDVPHLTANLSNLSALLFASLERINWAGFYLLEGETLVLGPFQGKPACIEIPLGKGVCGTAAAQDQTQLVADVHAFPGHIPCDSASRSELVVPLHGKTGIVGVLDIDSPYPARFTGEDKAGLEQFVRVIEQTLSDLL
jgi:GAF domain-containing protein